MSFDAIPSLSKCNCLLLGKFRVDLALSTKYYFFDHGVLKSHPTPPPPKKKRPSDRVVDALHFLIFFITSVTGRSNPRYIRKVLTAEGFCNHVYAQQKAYSERRLFDSHKGPLAFF